MDAYNRFDNAEESNKFEDIASEAKRGKKLEKNTQQSLSEL